MLDHLHTERTGTLRVQPLWKFDRYDIVTERDIEEGLGRLATGTVAGTSGEKTGTGHGSA